MEVDLDHALGGHSDGGVDLVLEPGSTGCQRDDPTEDQLEKIPTMLNVAPLTFVPHDPMQDDVLRLQFTPDASTAQVVQDGHDKASSTASGDEDGDVVTREIGTGTIRPV